MVTAVRLEDGKSIDVDGQLDEPFWQRAIPATDFLQVNPSNGAPATERTEVRVLFDQHRLYLGVICFDSEPNKMLGNQMQRDQPFFADDRFVWTIDTYLDGRTGYFFMINPSGAMADGLISPGASGGRGFGGQGFGVFNKAWDGIWIARVRRGHLGWTAEIEIPFRTLNFDPNAPAWGINFQRSVRRKNEENRWNGHARNQAPTQMSSAGLLVGIERVSQGFGLDVKPYLVADVAEAPGRGEPRKISADTGVDFFYNLTPKLRANFTLNTDFAETEVDRRRVNLTRFPLFFPEKRDFFLEGSSFFDFSREPGNAVVPFFSRTIGLDEEGRPQPVDFGVKLTGQITSHDLGLLQVRTGASGNVAGEDFTVFRTRRRFFTQSYIGMLYTRRAERDTSDPDRHTMGADFSLGTSRFRGSQNLEFSGFYLWTSNPLRIGKSAAYGLRLNYPNDLWNGRISFRELQENFDPAVGFVQRRNYRRLNPVLRFSPRPKEHAWIRRFSFQTFLDLITDTKNRVLTRNLDLTVFQLDLHSRDSFQVHVISNFERLRDDFEIHPGITLRRGSQYDFTRYRLFANTAAHRKVSVRSILDWGAFFSGRRREFSLLLRIRPRPGFLVDFSGEWNRVELAEGKFSTSLLQAVVGTQFNPWVSLVNNLQYDTVSRVAGWQFRFRWIVRPGNDVYFVYTHNWLDDPSGIITLDRQAAAKIIYTHRF